MQDLKLLFLISRLTKKDFEIELEDGNKLKFFTPNEVSISYRLFRGGYCKRCGRSCKVSFNLYWSQNEYDILLPKEIKEKLRPFKVIINGNEKYFYQYKNGRDIPCNFLEFDSEGLALCKIHKYNPIHCSLPPLHIDFYTLNEKKWTSIKRRPYGRNWQFKCPIEFSTFDEEKFLNWDMIQLRRLEELGKYLEIETYLPEVIKKIEEYLPKIKKMGSIKLKELQDKDRKIVIYSNLKVEKIKIKK